MHSTLALLYHLLGVVPDYRCACVARQCRDAHSFVLDWRPGFRFRKAFSVYTRHAMKGEHTLADLKAKEQGPPAAPCMAMASACAGGVMRVLPIAHQRPAFAIAPLRARNSIKFDPIPIESTLLTLT